MREPIWFSMCMYISELVFMIVSHSCEDLKAIFTWVFICKGANQFLLWKLSWEPDPKSGEHSKPSPPNTHSNLQYKNDLILNNIV
jgi:hypothetical protein